MSEDRLSKVLELNKAGWLLNPKDQGLLVAELEQVKAENKELNALFDLQHTRTQKAEHLWRIATGNHNIVPDLGVLIDWLIRKA